VLKGTVTVDNLDTPRLDIDLPTVNLAFDDIRGLSASTADLPAGGRYEGSLKVKGDTGRLATMTIDATIKRLLAARSDLSGSLSVKNLDKPQFTMSMQSDLLDVDALRASFGGGDDDARTPPKQNENPSGLGKSTRDMLAGVSGKATLKAKRAIVKGMTMTNFTGVLTMTRGVAKFETLDFGLYGGTVTASGTLLDLPSEKTKYDLRLSGTDIDFGAVVAAHTPIGRIFKGTVSPKLQVKGRGLAPGDFAISADGPASLSFKQLVIGGLDVLGPIGDAMKAGKATGFNAAAAKRESGLTLSNFTALTEFMGGRLRLQQPVEADTPLGRMRIEGTTGLDARLDLRSTLQLTPQTIATMTGGKVRVKDPVPVPMRIGGTWDKPQVSGVDVKALLAAVVGDAAKDVIDKGKDAARDAAKDAAKDALGNVLGGGKKKKKK
jgi:AsmA protein